MFLSNEDRQLAKDFVQHFAGDFKAVGYENPNATLIEFALRLPTDGAPSFSERLVLLHALLLIVADMPGKTFLTIQDRMWGVVNKRPQAVTDERRRRARHWLRTRREGGRTSAPDAPRSSPANERVVCSAGCGYVAAASARLLDTFRDAWRERYTLAYRCARCDATLTYQPPPVAAGGA